MELKKALHPLVVTVVLLAANTGCANPNKVAASGTPTEETSDTSLVTSDVKSLMYSVLSEITSLQPYMVSEKKFLDNANEKTLQSHFDELAKLSTKVLRQKKLQVPGYRLSGEALDEHFKEMRNAFKSGNKKYARWMLSATPYACASCHTQLANSPKPLWQMKGADLSGTDFEKADFLFATRNYDEAEQMYTKLIRSFPGTVLPDSKLESSQLETALKRKLTIFVKMRRDFASAEVSFKKDLLNKNLPKDDRENIESWLKQLAKISKQDPKIVSKPVKVIKYASSVLESVPRGFVSANYPKLVEILNSSSLLYQSLHEHPRDELTPSLLYWLAVADLSLNNEFFFSLGSTYLRECLMQYPKSPIAKRCYGEYELDVRNLYTGTRGTEIPEDVAQELKYFKNRVGISE